MAKLEFLKAALAVALSVLSVSPALAQLRREPPPKLGAQGAVGSPNHRQEWLLPTPDQINGSRAVLFRPDGKGPFRLALIAHDSPATRQLRAQMPHPDYPALTQALLSRGFAVLIPQRLGHGKTGGPFLEDPENCDNADYAASAQSTGEAIVATMTYIRAQPFIRKDASVIVGQGAGAWGALSLVDQNPKNISAVVAFAPGRDARRDKRAIENCAMDKFLASAKNFGDGAKVPVAWWVAENDAVFPPAFSQQLADVYREEDGKVNFQILPAYGSDGHALMETKDAALMEQLLATVPELNAPVASAARVSPPAPISAGAPKDAAPKTSVTKSLLQRFLPSSAAKPKQ